MLDEDSLDRHLQRLARRAAHRHARRPRPQGARSATASTASLRRRLPDGHRHPRRPAARLHHLRAVHRRLRRRDGQDRQAARPDRLHHRQHSMPRERRRARTPHWDWHHLLRPRTLIYSAPSGRRSASPCWSSLLSAATAARRQRRARPQPALSSRCPTASIRNGYTVKILQHDAGAAHVPHHASRTCPAPHGDGRRAAPTAPSSVDVCRRARQAAGREGLRARRRTRPCSRRPDPASDWSSVERLTPRAASKPARDDAIFNAPEKTRRTDHGATEPASFTGRHMLAVMLGLLRRRSSPSTSPWPISPTRPGPDWSSHNSYVASQELRRRIWQGARPGGAGLDGRASAARAEARHALTSPTGRRRSAARRPSACRASLERPSTDEQDPQLRPRW